ncbi:MAG: hypothetical protein ABII98_00410 [bacterium]|nr:hypothetical protein [Patescibacteria group bacterium]
MKSPKLPRFTKSQFTDRQKIHPPTPPFFAQAREKTSYAILKAKLVEYGQSVGLDLKMDEIGIEKVGEDVMHKVVICIK